MGGWQGSVRPSETARGVHAWIAECQNVCVKEKGIYASVPQPVHQNSSTNAFGVLLECLRRSSDGALIDMQVVALLKSALEVNVDARLPFSNIRVADALESGMLYDEHALALATEESARHSSRDAADVAGGKGAVSQPASGNGMLPSKGVATANGASVDKGAVANGVHGMCINGGVVRSLRSRTAAAH